MSVQLITYVDTPVTTKQSEMVVLLQKHYPCMVDAVHHNDMDYFKRNYKCNYRLFHLSEFLSSCLVENLEYAPDFGICFSEKMTVTEKDWICIERYIETLFFPDTKVAPVITQNAKDLLDFAKVQEPLNVPEDWEIPLNSYYALESMHIENQDICIIQVEKPFCDLPYTVVIRNYSRKGLRSFFTDLFICNSWGVATKDYLFLKNLWGHWGMEGELNLDQMLLEATQRCFPDEDVEIEKTPKGTVKFKKLADTEPEVYRKPMKDVVERILNKESCTRHDDTFNMQRLKKRKLDDLLIN